jgi:hypothetical protein
MNNASSDYTAGREHERRTSDIAILVWGKLAWCHFVIDFLRSLLLRGAILKRFYQNNHEEKEETNLG